MYIGNKPRIYAENAADYDTNGRGYLPDAQSCKVIEKLNGSYELQMYYPVTGKGYKNITMNAILYAPPNPYDNWQPFRIYNISRANNGLVKVNAEHKSYELSGYPCLPNDDYIETPGTCAQMMSYLQGEVARTAQALSTPAYTFQTDILDSVRWNIDKPIDVKSAMALAAKWFNGEWKYDGTVCKLCASRGQNRHVNVQYGSNLITLTQDEVDTSYTHIMPFWTDGTTTVYVNNYYISSSYTQPYMQKHILILDMSNSFDEEPTSQELADATTAWIEDNKPKGIEKNLKVTFVARGQTIEYASLNDIDHVELGDTIGCKDYPLNISEELRCISLTYDVLRGMYDTAELGEVKSDLTTAAIEVQAKEEYPTVWVSVQEPTKGYKSGDYWIKINNVADRIAQGLGRFAGGAWILLCDFPQGGTGVFLDDAHTSVAHNDVENNTSNLKYDSIEGKNNSSTGTAGYEGCNHVGGKNNDVKSSSCSEVTGYTNTINNDAYCSYVAGANSIYNQYIQHSVSVAENCTLTSIANSFVSAYNKTLNNVSHCWVSGSGGTVYNTYNSIIIGGGNVSNCGNSILFGINASNVTNSLVLSAYALGNSISGIVVGGQGSVVTHNNCGVFGNNHVANHEDTLYCGTGATGNDGTTAYYFAVGNGTRASPNNIFTVDTSGNVKAAGTITPNGADYAEYFEWADGNPDNEDRRGMLVTLDGDKIIPAHGNEYIGVISSNPSMIGNSAEMHWHGKYKTDVFGQTMKDDAGKPIISDKYKKQRYIPRSQRSEWGLVGLVGRLIIIDDGSCKIGGYVSARRGIGTSCYSGTNARVLRRIDKNHVEVLLK